MVEIGKCNNLTVVKIVDFGIYLDGGQDGEILMPRRYVPENCNIDDVIEAFIYLDSEDRLIATTEKPYSMVGDFALLKVISVNDVGTFLDWGLQKDLFVPFREQLVKMQEGKSYIVYIYLDVESKRIVASTKIDKFLNKLPIDYKQDQEVDLLIHSQTDIGYKAIINNSHWGILYSNEVFQPLAKGLKVKGYIKKVREDEKIDLSLYQPGYGKVDDISKKILNILQEHGGFLNVTDKSPSDTIYEIFGVSKKVYKMAIGALYKAKLITLEHNGIKLKK
jgi:predicted RNA-binding protein (virulence factor B family)